MLVTSKSRQRRWSKEKGRELMLGLRCLDLRLRNELVAEWGHARTAANRGFVRWRGKVRVTTKHSIFGDGESARASLADAQRNQRNSIGPEFRLASHRVCYEA